MVTFTNFFRDMPLISHIGHVSVVVVIVIAVMTVTFKLRGSNSCSEGNSWLGELQTECRTFSHLAPIAFPGLLITLIHVICVQSVKRVINGYMKF